MYSIFLKSYKEKFLIDQICSYCKKFTCLFITIFFRFNTFGIIY